MTCSRRVKLVILATAVNASIAGVGPVEKLRGGSSNCHCTPFAVGIFRTW